MAGHSAAYALYERAGDVLPDNPQFHRSLSDPAFGNPLLRSVEALGWVISVAH